MGDGSFGFTCGELETIVRRAARVLKMDLADDGAAEIAKRSRGTPLGVPTLGEGPLKSHAFSGEGAWDIPP